MRTTGIIAEYNPFHNGHKYHIEKSREISGAENIAVIMSGDFTQRGEPSIIDKYKRTKMALNNGADLVIELPVIFAASSAEYFAYAAVKTLHLSGIVDCLCFGSETGGLQALSKAAEGFAHETDEYRERLHGFLDEGLSFAKARSKALAGGTVAEEAAGEVVEFAEIISQPNDILAVEYLKALKKINSEIEPYVIHRKGSGYNCSEIKGIMSSATAVRGAILRSDWESVEMCVPPDCAEILRYSRQAVFDDFSLLLHAELLRKTPEELSGAAFIGEGLENRIISAASRHYLLTEIADAVKTKRYAHSRIRRILLFIILGITKEIFDSFRGEPAYIRVLGFRREKECLVSDLCAKSRLPIIMNAKQHREFEKGNEAARDMMSIDIMASALYNAAVKEPRHEYTQPLVIV